MKFPVLGLFLALFVLCAEIRGADPGADAAWRAFSDASHIRPAKPTEEFTPLERLQWLEQRALKLRELGQAFIDGHPTDPRRWNVVLILLRSRPQFVTEWGATDAEGNPVHPVIDEVAAAAWKAKLAELDAAMIRATDLTDSLKKALAARETAKARQQAFRDKWQGGRREPAPDFVAQDFAGRAVRLSDYRGKVVVLDFWASWCGPCKAAMPHNEEVATEYKDQDVVILAVCVWDTKDKADAWMKENQPKYADLHWAFSPAGRGEGDPAKKLYNVGGIPTQFIIDREGRVVDAIVGYAKGENILEAALSKAGVKVDPALVAKGEADLKKRGS